MNVIYFPQKREQKKVIRIPVFFTRLLNLYRQRQDEIKKKKINALYAAVYEYFLTCLQNDKKVSLPPMLLAEEKASEEMMRIISKSEINEYFTLLKKAEKSRARG